MIRITILVEDAQTIADNSRCLRHHPLTLVGFVSVSILLLYVLVELFGQVHNSTVIID